MLKLQVREIGAWLSSGNAEVERVRAAAPAVPNYWVCSWDELGGGTGGTEVSADKTLPDTQEPLTARLR